MNLTLEQRDRLRAVLPKYEQKPIGRRRADPVRVFEGILWVLETGAQWEKLDKHVFGVSYQTCHRYYQEWVAEGVFERGLVELVRDSEDAGLLRLRESYMDGSFVRAKGGGDAVGYCHKGYCHKGYCHKGYCHKGKGSRVMSQVEENGLPISPISPISLSPHGASAHEVTLAFDLVTGCWTREMPGIVVGDKAYDSDPLDDELGACGVEVVAPHRKGRKRPATQDEEGMASYQGRWKVERFFSWLQRFRRLVVRYERKAANFLGFVQLAAIIMHVRYRY